jgi:hypothetical protein
VLEETYKNVVSIPDPYFGKEEKRTIEERKQR